MNKTLAKIRSLENIILANNNDDIISLFIKCKFHKHGMFMYIILCNVNKKTEVNM